MDATGNTGGISYSNRGREVATEARNAISNRITWGDARKIIGDGFQKTLSDPSTTYDEKKLAELGKALVSKKSLSDEAAGITALVVLDTLKNAVPGPFGCVVAHSLTEGHYKSLVWSDIRTAMNEGMKAIEGHKGTGGDQKALAKMGIAVNEAGAVTAEHAGTIDYLIMNRIADEKRQAPVNALMSFLNNGDFSQLTWGDLRLMLGEGFRIIESDPGSSLELKGYAGLGNSYLHDNRLNDTAAGTVGRMMAGLMDSPPGGTYASNVCKALNEGSFKSIEWRDLRRYADKAFESIMTSGKPGEAEKAVIRLGQALNGDPSITDEKAGRIDYMVFDTLSKGVTGTPNEAMLSLFTNSDLDKITVIEHRKMLHQLFYAMQAGGKCTPFEESLVKLGSAYIDTKIPILAGRVLDDGSASLAGNMVIKMLMSKPTGNFAQTVAKAVYSESYTGRKWEDFNGISDRAFEAMQSERGTGEAEKALADLGRAIIKDKKLESKQAGEISYMILKALQSPTSSSAAEAVSAMLSSADYSSTTWGSANALISKGFDIIRKDPSATEFQKACIDIAKKSTKSMDDVMAGKVQILFVDPIAQPGQSSSWARIAEIVGNANYSKFTWEAVNALLGEAFPFIIKDADAPEAVKALAGKGAAICRDRSKDAPKGGNEALEIMKQIAALKVREVKAREEIEKMAENLDSDRMPSNTIENDDGYVSIGGVKLEIRQENRPS